METTPIVRAALYFVFFSVFLSACQSGSDDEDKTFAIEFTNPEGVTAIATPDIVINLSGIVKSQQEIDAVSWVNDRGGRGKANGKEQWMTGNIVLQVGLNNITITATDEDGENVAKSIAVTREDTFAPTVSNTSADPVVLYSYSSDLQNSAPVKDAVVRPGPVYFFLDPGSQWASQGIGSVKYLCCRGMSGPGAGTPHAPAVGVAGEPWVHFVDLSGAPAGGVRRISVFAVFIDGTESNQPVFDFSIATPGGNQNLAPSISGNPNGIATVGTQYNFRPTGQDPNGDSIRFSISNKPVWAVFDPSTGRLHGTPASSDIGRYESIIISVSDGQVSTSLAPFSITVEAQGANAAVLNWISPTQRTDNTPLTGLAGFNLYYGQTPGDYANRLQLSNAGLTSYMVENLSDGNWYFVVTAVDNNGLESNVSNEVIRSY